MRLSLVTECDAALTALLKLIGSVRTGEFDEDHDASEALIDAAQSALDELRDHLPCATCNGQGEIQHPRWGSRSCPEPYIPCPDCR